MSCSERGLELTDYLGKGSFADAIYYRAKHAGGGTVAVKVVPSGPSQDNYDKVRAEIDLLSQCHSPFIVGFVEWFVHPITIEMWIVEEYCDAGRLVDLIDGGLPEDCIRAICASLLLALEHLHCVRQVCHRDIRSSGVLLTHDGHVKLTGFGFAAKLSSNNNRVPPCLDNWASSAYWMAPENIRESFCGPCSDIWSLGIVTIEMAEGSPPHSKMKPCRACFVIPVKPSPTLADPDNWSPEMLDFVRICCQKDSSKRLDSIRLSMHPFVKSNVVALHAATGEQEGAGDGYSKLTAPRNPGLLPVRKLIEAKRDKLDAIQRERQEEYTEAFKEDTSRIQRKRDFVRDYLLDATKSPEEQEFMHDLEVDPNRSFSKFAAVSYDEDEFDAPQTVRSKEEHGDNSEKGRRHIRRRSSLDEAVRSLGQELFEV